MRRTPPATGTPRTRPRRRFPSGSGPLRAPVHGRPECGRRRRGATGSGRVPGMYAQHVTNWWWTAHPAAR
ncbi:trp operon leader peptide [Streptomyces catenulae]|uniref:Trp operon leader peptide n=1 Tax=Streptomyces catenulae TaxID=66875 RepID=A0ABV2Z8I6_9ACTN